MVWVKNKIGHGMAVIGLGRVGAGQEWLGSVLVWPILVRRGRIRSYRVRSWSIMSWLGVGKFRDIRDSWVLSGFGQPWSGKVRFGFRRVGAS